MSVTVKLVGDVVEILQGASSLPEGEEIMLFSSSDRINLERERREEVDLKVPSFLRGDEDEDATCFPQALTKCMPFYLCMLNPVGTYL